MNPLKLNLKKYIPYVVALVTFLAVTALYFAPQFEGKALQQSDMIQYEGFKKDIQDHVQKYGEHPQWEGNMFGGMPAYLIDMDYSGRLVKEAASGLYFLGEPAAYFFLAMAGFFFMLLCFGISPWLALVGGLAYGLSTYFYIIIDVGHITKMMALACAPPLIGTTFFTYRKNYWVGAALTGLLASIEISCSHPQITYYFLFILLALFVNEAVRAVRQKLLPRFFKATALLALAGALAVGSNANQLWFVYNHTPETMRGGSELSAEIQKGHDAGLTLDYATQWSYGKIESFNLLIPNLMGGSSSSGFAPDGEVAQALVNYNARSMATHLPAYWGGQPFTAGPTYIGAVLIFLFVFGMLLLHGKTKWWIFSVTLLSLFLAWGSNMMWLTELFYKYFPLYNKFRTVAMILVIAQCTIPLLGILALQQLWTREIPKPRFYKALKYATVITGGIALAFTLFGSTMFSFSSPTDTQFPADVATAMRSERALLLRSDAFRTFIFVILTAGLLWLFYAGKAKRWLFVGGLSLLVLCDLVPIDLRFLNHNSFVPKKEARAIQPTAADQQILTDTEPGYRVANLSTNSFNEAMTAYFHRTTGGYHPAKLRRYQDLIDRYLGAQEINWNVYNILNTKYFIFPSPEGEPKVQLNPDNLGAAWFVEGINWVNGADEELDAIGLVDLSSRAVVDKKFQPEVTNLEMSLNSTPTSETNPEKPTAAEAKTSVTTSLATPTSGRSEATSTRLASTLQTRADRLITLTDYKINHLTYTYTTDQAGIAVFSEIYYPKGWTATLDGKPAAYFRANYILRAMELPAGTHTVEFRFKTPDFNRWATITYTCSLLLLLGTLATLILTSLHARKRKTDSSINA